MDNRVVILAVVLLLIVLLAVWKSSHSSSYQPFVSSQDVESIERYIDPRVNDNTTQLIPRVIIQTNDSASVPVRMKEAMSTIINKNPEYTYRYFTDADRYEFIKNNFTDERVLRAYKKIIPGAFKADLFRYCYLFKYGGVYIDSSMLCITPLKEVINSADVFIASEDNRSGSVYNAVLMCAPYSPVLAEAIEKGVTMILAERYGNNMLDITGPGCLRDSFKTIISSQILPDREYGKGVRLLNHTWYPQEHAGTITSNNKLIFRTKYPGYKEDKVWYNTIKNYAILWEEHNIYHRDG